MASSYNSRGQDELRQIRRESRTLYWFVGIFSFFVNMLMLTGPIYMLQVYDRVLGSRSEAALVTLSLVVVFLYAMMGLLDYTRGRVMGRVVQISADAFQDDARQISYYRAEIVLSEGEQDKIPQGITLIPGMPVESFIKTNDRTPLAYLVKPLADYFAKAMRES